MTRRNARRALGRGVTGARALAAALVAALALLASPAWSAQGDCSQPVSTGAAPTVSDCLFILRTAVGSSACDPECICAPKGTLPTSAADALLCLKRSVGQDVSLTCPCEGTTSTTHTTVTTGTTNTTSTNGATTSSTNGPTTTTTGPTTTSTTGPTTTTTLASDVETQVFPNACVSVTLRPSVAFTTKVRGNAAITVAIDHATLGDRDADGLEDVSAEITDFNLTTSNALLGTIVVKLPDPDVDPGENRRTFGVIEETANTTPGVLDVPPYAGAGSAVESFELFIQASFSGGSLGSARLHHHTPIGLAGTLTHSPPPAGELLVMQNTESIPVLQDDESQYGSVVIDTADKATIDLSANGCE